MRRADAREPVRAMREAARGLRTRLRVTVRGSDIPGEAAVKVKFAPDGAAVIIK